MKYNKNNNFGFTLVELVVSIGILLLIVSIAVPSIIGLVDKSEKKVNKAIQDQLITYAKSYVNSNNLESKLVSGNMYCMTVNDLQKEKLIDEDMNDVSGRIEIKKENSEEIKYSYSTTNNNSGCTTFPNTNINYNDEEVTLRAGDGTIDPETLKGELIDKYNYYTTIPDFKNKSPKNNEEAGTYRDVKSVLITYNDSFVNPGVDAYHDNMYTSFPVFCRDLGSDCNLDVESSAGHKVAKYLGSSYTFDVNTGKYKLEDYVEGYINKEFDNGRIYMCDNYETECDTMYEISDYGTILSAFGYTIYRWGLMAHIKSYYEHTAMYSLDSSDSGLYRTMDEEGMTYYFRGAVTNNFVKFDGSDQLFKILRFNGDGSTRLVSTSPTYNSGGYDTIFYQEIVEGEEDDIKIENATLYSDINMIDGNTISFENAETINNIYQYRQNNKREMYNYNGTLQTKNTVYPILYMITNKHSVTPIEIENYDKVDLNNYDIYKISNVDSTNKLTIKKIGIEDKLLSDLNKWYEENMSEYDRYIVKGTFCSDVNRALAESDNLLHGIDLTVNGTPYGEWKKGIDISSAVTRLSYDSDFINPTYICNDTKDTNGNGGKFISKVGTLSADDVAFAGAIGDYYWVGNQRYIKDTKSYTYYATNSYSNFDPSEFENNSYNPDFFLYVPEGFITTTAYSLKCINYNNRCTVDARYILSTMDYRDIYPKNVMSNYAYLADDSQNSKNNGYSLNYMYPVINISGDIKIKSGNGTVNDPYILDTPVGEDDEIIFVDE